MTARARWMGTLLTTMGILLALAGCGGDGSAPPDNGGGGGGGSGTPIGDPVSATIDAAGGTLATPDGGFTLTVPAGALAAATALTVQQVVNDAPYGVGKSYRLSPANLTFAQPVDISIAVDSAELGDLVPAGLVVGLQNAAGDWFAKLRSGVRPEAIRTSGRAPSVAYARRGTRIGTFTEFDGIDSNQWRRIAIVAFWVVEPTRARVRVGETQNLRVLVCTRNELVELGAVGEDDLAPLPGSNALPSPRPPQGCAPSVRDGFWYVNNVNGGNSVAGTVTAGSPNSTAIFRAPATVPNPAKVTVTAEMSWSTSDVTDFDIPIEIYNDRWQGTMDWTSEGDSTETYPNGSLVITYRAAGTATYAPAPPGSGLTLDENGGFLRANSISASSYYRRVKTLTFTDDDKCEVTEIDTITETSGTERFTALPADDNPFKALWDVLFQLRDDGQYLISGGIGPVPTTRTSILTRTTSCPGSAPSTTTPRSTVEADFDGVLGPVQELRRFSPGDKVFKNQVTNLTERDIRISTDVNWEFTRP